jgi:hypothetical protein
VTPGNLTVQSTGYLAQASLVETFFDAQKRLSVTPVIKAIAGRSA